MRAAHMRILGAAISLLLLTACGIDIPPPDRGGEVRAPWVLSGGDGDRLELAIMVGGADCERFAGVDVTESDQNVEIRAWVKQLRTDSCYMVGRGYHPVTVDFSSPLGDLTLTGCMIEGSAPHDTRESCADLVDF